MSFSGAFGMFASVQPGTWHALVEGVSHDVVQDPAVASCFVQSYLLHHYHCIIYMNGNNGTYLRTNVFFSHQAGGHYIVPQTYTPIDTGFLFVVRTTLV